MSSLPGRASEKTRRKWQSLIERWQQSGLSARAFAAQEHVSQASLFVWRKFLRAFSDSQTQPVSPTPAFVQLKLPDATLCEIVLPSGILLRLPLSSDPALITAWIRAASEAPR